MARGKRWPYNSGLAVPMVVYFPDKWKHLAPKEYKAGGTSDRLVNFVDLAPTLLSLAGVKPPEWMQGHAFAGTHQQKKPKYMFGFRDRMDERYDFIRTVTDGRFHYIRNYDPHFIYGQFVQYNFVTPSTSAWKRDYDAGTLNGAQSHFWNLKPAEELYDLQADPDEVHNLANSAEHQAKLKELRQAQQDWCRDIRDLGFLPEGEIHSRSQGTTPREMGHEVHSICPQRFCARRSTRRINTSATQKASSEFAPCRRSEEHTSELQSQAYLVCRLLLEKKKKSKKKKKKHKHKHKCNRGVIANTSAHSHTIL